MRDRSLITRIECRLFARKMRGFGMPYHVIAEILEVSTTRVFNDTRDVVPNKAPAPAPPLTLADAITFLNAEGFEVIAMAAQPSRREMQQLRRKAA